MTLSTRKQMSFVQSAVAAKRAYPDAANVETPAKRKRGRPPKQQKQTTTTLKPSSGKRRVMMDGRAARKAGSKRRTSTLYETPVARDITGHDVDFARGYTSETIGRYLNMNSAKGESSYFVEGNDERAEPTIFSEDQFGASAGEGPLTPPESSPGSQDGRGQSLGSDHFNSDPQRRHEATMGRPFASGRRKSVEEAHIAAEILLAMAINARHHRPASNTPPAGMDEGGDSNMGNLAGDNERRYEGILAIPTPSRSTSLSSVRDLASPPPSQTACSEGGAVFHCRWPDCYQSFSSKEAVTSHVTAYHMSVAADNTANMPSLTSFYEKLAVENLTRMPTSTEGSFTTEESLSSHDTCNRPITMATPPQGMQMPGRWHSAPTWNVPFPQQPILTSPPSKRVLYQPSVTSGLPTPPPATRYHRSSSANPNNTSSDSDDEHQISRLPVYQFNGISSARSSSEQKLTKKDDKAVHEASLAQKARNDGRKCRKVYGMDHKDKWCTQCRWKKACVRFND